MSIVQKSRAVFIVMAWSLLTTTQANAKNRVSTIEGTGVVTTNRVSLNEGLTGLDFTKNISGLPVDFKVTYFRYSGNSTIDNCPSSPSCSTGADLEIRLNNGGPFHQEFPFGYPNGSVDERITFWTGQGQLFSGEILDPNEVFGGASFVQSGNDFIYRGSAESIGRNIYSFFGISARFNEDGSFGSGEGSYSLGYFSTNYFNLEVSFDITRAEVRDFSHVPEPSAWLMSLAGFFIVGVAARRKHRNIDQVYTGIPVR
ncbi:hypothetical protein [Sandarakinorhabdus rubra]|uniref:hypothetical protein n=1 Tax=Sandarakinorhabdus rubra TaxID=2672568 RepID=UPI0013DB14EB|nr:hypothetical protein [Sandarakinorhabdus rubra]